MKRIFLAVVLTLALLVTSGCRDSSAPGFGQEDLYLNIDGTHYSLNMNIKTVIAALGSDYTYSEAQSCDYDGLDKTFTFGIAQFYTYPLPEGDLISEIYTEDPAVSTSKGICVGLPKEDVLARYGAECEDTGYQLVYRLPDPRGTAGESSLCFDMEGGIVKAIYITALAV